MWNVFKMFESYINWNCADIGSYVIIGRMRPNSGLLLKLQAQCE